MEKKFIETIRKCEEMIAECGFELPKIGFALNNRFSSTLGRCRKLSDKQYMIEISKKYVQGCIETGNIRKLEQTILHEMAHTLINGFNHGMMWKAYADVINRRFGYEITRITTVSNEIREYWIKDGVRICCDDCGKDNLRKRSNKVVRDIQYYKCSCGGKLYLREVI